MGVGKVPDEAEGGLQAILEGNHDNPESGTHQAPSHWEPQWKEAQILPKTASREEGWLGAKNNDNYSIQSKVSKMIDSYESAVKSLRPCQTPRPSHIQLVVKTAGQDCLMFNLA